MKATKRSATLSPVVIGVTALMAMLFLSPPKLWTPGAHTKSQIAKIQIKELEVALQLFRFDTKRYPTSEEGLNALIHSPGNLKSWKGPYLKRVEVPRDPWGKYFIYRCPPQNGTYDLICYGRDGAPGGKEGDEDIILLNREFPK